MLPPQASASVHGSYARETVSQRLPAILTRAIDRCSRALSSTATDSDQLRAAVSSLVQLKYQLTHDKALGALEGTLVGDEGEWNEALVAAGRPSWFSASWLLAECYMYRRIRAANIPFDVFAEGKQHSFHECLPAMETLAHTLKVACQSVEDRTHLRRFLECSLWGNRADLSHSATAPSADDDQAATVDTIDDARLRELAATRLLIDDVPAIEALLTALPSPSRIDIVLDNAGYELFSDLCLAEWLLTANVGSHIVLHVKDYPWFVSDVTPSDLTWTLDQLSASHSDALSALAQRWSNRLYHDDPPTLQIHQDPFWTQPHSFCDMPSRAPQLYSFLQDAALVIFKGDLNYRKLVADRMWEYDTDVSVALEGFLPTSVCSLRTLKAECVVGVELDKVKRVRELDGDAWLNNGKNGVISLVAKGNVAK